MEDEYMPSDLTPIYDRLDAGEIRMQRIEDELGKNTTVTEEVRDILAAAKMGLKVVGGLGMLLRWAAPIGAAAAGVWAVLHGGPK